MIIELIILSCNIPMNKLVLVKKKRLLSKTIT